MAPDWVDSVDLPPNHDRGARRKMSSTSTGCDGESNCRLQRLKSTDRSQGPPGFDERSARPSLVHRGSSFCAQSAAR